MTEMGSVAAGPLLAGAPLAGEGSNWVDSRRAGQPLIARHWKAFNDVEQFSISSSVPFGIATKIQKKMVV